MLLFEHIILKSFEKQNIKLNEIQKFDLSNMFNLVRLEYGVEHLVDDVKVIMNSRITRITKSRKRKDVASSCLHQIRQIVINLTVRELKERGMLIEFYKEIKEPNWVILNNLEKYKDIFTVIDLFNFNYSKNGGWFWRCTEQVIQHKFYKTLKTEIN